MLLVMEDDALPVSNASAHVTYVFRVYATQILTAILYRMLQCLTAESPVSMASDSWKWIYQCLSPADA